MQKVLVTGLSGFIGSEMRKRLEGKYELFALNRRDVAGIPTHRADIGDFEAIRPAFEGKDAVVHLSAGFDTQGWDAVLNANIVGTYNVYEAARQAGVSRVVFASSGKVIGRLRDRRALQGPRGGPLRGCASYMATDYRRHSL